MIQVDWMGRGHGRNHRLRTGSRNTLLHPGFNFVFEPAGATAQLDRFREVPVLNKLVEPLVGHPGKRSDKRHVDKWVPEPEK